MSNNSHCDPFPEIVEVGQRWLGGGFIYKVLGPCPGKPGWRLECGGVYTDCDENGWVSPECQLNMLMEDE